MMGDLYLRSWRIMGDLRLRLLMGVPTSLINRFPTSLSEPAPTTVIGATVSFAEAISPYEVSAIDCTSIFVMSSPSRATPI